ncbi:hypothetical protein RN001_013202 [Aquatica leii]|uniref:Dynein regulatory complex protein 10 n=1 Tax=Aquatica leii TaxID=1421715 RepID=A0AAN7SCA4_9COLE|nr:hypothetical protein RN001_013202 [Aquatica leii]
MSNKTKPSLKGSVSKTSSGSIGQNGTIQTDSEELELQIQNQRILVLIDSAIEKIKVASMKTSSVYNIKNKFVDLHLKQALEILCQNHKLKEEAQEEYKFYVDPACLHFIEMLQQIRGIVSDKLKMTAATAINKEKALNKAWRENRILEKHLSEINQEIARQRQAFIDEVNSRHETIRELHMNIRDYEFDFKEDARNLVEANDISMIEDREISKQKQVDLSYDTKAIQQQYETLLTKHLNQERKLRAKRLKVEQQLVNWLAKYDSDMSDRQKEFDELTQGFNEEHQELTALQAMYDEQLPIHTALMAEKSEDEYKEWCAAVLNFIRNRSAKLIQRWWRPYCRVILEKRAARRAAAKARAKKK